MTPLEAVVLTEGLADKAEAIAKDVASFKISMAGIPDDLLEKAQLDPDLIGRFKAALARLEKAADSL